MQLCFLSRMSELVEFNAQPVISEVEFFFMRGSRVSYRHFYSYCCGTLWVIWLFCRYVPSPLRALALFYCDSLTVLNML